MNVFTCYKSKEGKPYLKPQIGKFGVKAISIQLNDGTVKKLDNDSVLFMSPNEITVKKTGEKKVIHNVWMPENPRPYNDNKEQFTQDEIPF